ncbi:MAG TPA: Gfo/Idh/MocA family oxidoreductase [Ramlibacter sp.]|uniref:Gfo/Idh/MocA family protein n=1 Tax=Ramlibacter sp. TaxID=1917967 RepID=UPI002BCA297C|nr:Gfo/Idh/MocA family oxidoreductase [Ramlibacter sp.]HVZ43536.1 Gfo/Idh/MocA family oxidoreductase [Ramlibacter sp.]
MHEHANDSAPAGGRPLRWGLVGSSSVAATHMIPAIRDLCGHEIVAVMSRDRERGAAFAKAHGIAQAVTSIEELLALPLDAVYISSTNELHAAQAIACARAGRHVLCEKPIALTLEDAQAVVDAARKAGVVLATNHHIRNAAAVIELRSALQQGLVGDLLSVRIANSFALPANLQGWRVDSPTGGGAILDVGVHMADSLRFILDREPLEIWGTMNSVRLGKPGVDDNAMAVVRLEGDLFASLHVGFATPFAQRVWEFLGSRGTLVATNPNIPTPGAQLVLRDAHGTRELPFVHRNLYEGTVRHFASAVSGEGRPAATGEDGVRSLAFALAWIESARAGRSVRIPTDATMTGSP